MSAIDDLATLLRELDVPIAIGLRQQGHLPAVKRMLAEGKSWEEIGAAIHWHPKAAEEWFRIEDRSAAMDEALEQVKAFRSGPVEMFWNALDSLLEASRAYHGECSIAHGEIEKIVDEWWAWRSPTKERR